MNDKFQDVLNGINAKTGRSRLEPYGELVDELRRHGLTCRDIASVLAQKCQFQTSKSGVNNLCEHEREGAEMPLAESRDL